MRQDVVASGQSARPQGLGAGRPQAGVTWRHVATALLLVLVVPVLLAAGIAALLVVPVMLALVGIDQIRQLAGKQPRPAPIRYPR
ncbi:hypothetical protein [uncultured Piscinibacter sp.]|uniref:hypothetical protein n=1 Tax=uncultured Piscinibacter sp. TaxID=1131835 RepID=UPI002617132A|nr:hypothetical protein [uncultured Piscinibacter sp.]